ncbi:MAG TPA: S1 RNA-binding domain-containing protein, partial [Terriglobales bacterium]|nr:S1 RNA-binding domain-containing protein [Terriglobales bacterium]
YLGKVSRLADFGAFVEILPGTDGLLHISEVAEHRIKDIRDELKEGDQVLVKVLSIEGNRIRLSRKAILKEQRAKMAPAEGTGAIELGESPVVTIEGGQEYGDDEEPNFNRAAGESDGEVGAETRPERGPRPGGDRGGRPGGGGGRGGRRRHGGGGGGGSRGPRR